MNSLGRCALLLSFIIPIIFHSNSSATSIEATLQSRFGAHPGEIVEMSLLLRSSQQLGGVDFTISYQDSIFEFVSAQQDTGLKHWEYFLSANNPAKGIVRVVSIADIENGPIHPDSVDFYPKGSIVKFRFSSMLNWNADSSQIPFSFYWGGCGDNAVSDRSGYSLIVVQRVYDSQGQLLWDETNNTLYPESLRIANIGLPDSCIQTKAELIYDIDFHSGVVANYVICGNTDANALVNVSDVVYLITYVFTGGPPPAPLSSGDVDCNGIVNVSDIAYLIAFVFGGGTSPCQCL